MHKSRCRHNVQCSSHFVGRCNDAARSIDVVVFDMVTSKKGPVIRAPHYSTTPSFRRQSLFALFSTHSVTAASKPNPTRNARKIPASISPVILSTSTSTTIHPLARPVNPPDTLPTHPNHRPLSPYTATPRDSHTRPYARRYLPSHASTVAGSRALSFFPSGRTWFRIVTIRIMSRCAVTYRGSGR